MAEGKGPVLTTWALNRAPLARQLLLERATGTMEAAVEQVGGLQTQNAPSGYTVCGAGSRAWCARTTPPR